MEKHGEARLGSAEDLVSSEKGCVRPQAQLQRPLFSEEARSRGISENLWGPAGSPVMRNTWVPRVPEALCTRLLF